MCNLKQGDEMLKEFMAFIKMYGVIGLAVAVIIGGKLNELVKSIVDNLLMPFLGLVVPSGDWRNLAFYIGETKFSIGPVIGSSLDFLIVSYIVFLFSKLILKEHEVSKK